MTAIGPITARPTTPPNQTITASPGPSRMLDDAAPSVAAGAGADLGSPAGPAGGFVSIQVPTRDVLAALDANTPGLGTHVATSIANSWLAALETTAAPQSTSAPAASDVSAMIPSAAMAAALDAGVTIPGPGVASQHAATVLVADQAPAAAVIAASAPAPAPAATAPARAAETEPAPTTEPHPGIKLPAVIAALNAGSRGQGTQEAAALVGGAADTATQTLRNAIQWLRTPKDA